MRRFLTRSLPLVVASVCALCDETWAQPPPPVEYYDPWAPQPRYAPPYAEPAPRLRRRRPRYSPSQLALSFGGGPADYFGNRLGRVDTGVTWDARLTVGTRSFVGMEVAYVGSVNELETRGGRDGALYANGLEGALRLNLTRTRLQPYVFGGVGYNYMFVDTNGNPALLARFRSEDDQLLVPAGGGLTAYLGRYGMVDARFTYRGFFDNDIVRGRDGSLHLWSVTGRMGVAF